MAELPRPARWRCPACGTALDPSETSLADEIRLRCPDCGGLFRVRRREGSGPSTAVFSGEVPAARPAAPPIVGGFGLAWRGLALQVMVPIFHVGNTLGAVAMLALGGIVPVARGWLRDQVGTGSDVVRTLGGVTVTMPATDPDADLGPAIARGDAPELFTEIADAARRLAARPPQQVRLTYLPCCGVVAWDRSRALVLGLPLLHVLTRVELRAILAHELAHLARGDATSAARSSRFVQGLGQALDEAPSPSLSPLRLWARLCRRVSDTLHAPIARGQEARADRASASLAGGDAAASALVKVAAVQSLFREVMDAYDPTDPELPNLYAFFRLFWSRLPDSLLTAIRHRLLRDGETAPDPAHPPLLDRLASVQSYPARPSSESDSLPASSTLGDLEALEQMLHNRLFAVDRVEPSVFHRTGRS